MTMQTPQRSLASMSAGGAGAVDSGGTGAADGAGALGGRGTGSFGVWRPASASRHQHRRVTDAPTRAAHWLMALSFAGAYLTADGEAWRALHVTLGYTLLGALVFRLGYGLLGPRQAAWGGLMRKLAGLPTWLRGVVQTPLPLAPHWRQGQHLLMALAVAGLMGLALPLTLSGYATFNEWGDAISATIGLGGDGEWLAEVHEFFGNAMLALVLAHVGLITGLSLLRRKNVARPMLTGRADGPGPDLARHNHGWLAALVLLAALAFGVWQWQQFPNGLLPASGGDGAASQTLRGGGQDDEDD